MRVCVLCVGLCCVCMCMCHHDLVDEGAKLRVRHIPTRVCICVSMCVYVCLCVVCMDVCLCVYIYECVYVCLCVYGCLSVRLCMCAYERNFIGLALTSSKAALNFGFLSA